MFSLWKQLPNGKVQSCRAWFLGQVMVQDSVIQLQPDALTSAETGWGGS